MEHDFWRERWLTNQIGFHEKDGNKLLARHFDAIEMPAGARYFLPLCGKTGDITRLLGKGYRGYYPVGDERALAALLWRGETDTRFLPSLQRQCDKLRPLFTPESESRALARVVKAASRAVTRSN